MTLSDQLREAFAKSQANFPPEALAIMKASDAELLARGVGKEARTVGDWLPNVPLLDTKGDVITLRSLNETGPLIITFYRGGWCPYCNLELRAYQDVLDEITGLGGQLVAITPEKPDHSLTTVEKSALQFPVLTDTGNQFAKAMGIAFELPIGLQNLFVGFGMDIAEVNADTGWALPIPATFVVDAQDRIVFASVDLDYTQRAEPADAIAALRACTHSIE